MKVSIENLGVIKEADFEIGDLTIICGKNNTGKTYLTHATHGFLDALPGMDFPINKEIIGKLIKGGSVTLPLSSYRKNLNRSLKSLSKRYSQELGSVFAGNERRFKDANFCFQLNTKEDLFPFSNIQEEIEPYEGYYLDIHLSKDKASLVINSTMDAASSDEMPHHYMIKRDIDRGIGQALLDTSTVPRRPFIASTMRTGAAIFQRELDFTKNRLWELMNKNGKSPRLSLSLLHKEFGGIYPYSIRRNIDFLRRLPSVSHRESDLLKKHPDLLDFFIEIIGGELKISKEGIITFTPASNKNVTLALLESSSSVYSLLDINFYLRHHAKPGDILIIDEPELNLHPENQRLIARLFARLVNAGIKVFISTHSDYIIKELNTLIMFKQGGKWLKQLAEQEGYIDSELIDKEQVKAYMTVPLKAKSGGTKKQVKYQTLVPMQIDSDLGMEAKSFDKTIDDMNRIQDEIMWGGDE